MYHYAKIMLGVILFIYFVCEIREKDRPESFKKCKPTDQVDVIQCNFSLKKKCWYNLL